MTAWCVKRNFAVETINRICHRFSMMGAGIGIDSTTGFDISAFLHRQYHKLYILRYSFYYIMVTCFFSFYDYVPCEQKIRDKCMKPTASGYCKARIVGDER